jgi:hypothetical protein
LYKRSDFSKAKNFEKSERLYKTEDALKTSWSEKLKQIKGRL